jgi:hypothetical protein
MNWNMVREKSIVLYGPSPKTLIDPIGFQEASGIMGGERIAWMVYIDPECSFVACRTE